MLFPQRRRSLRHVAGPRIGRLLARGDVLAWPRGLDAFPGRRPHTADNGMAGMAASLNSSWAIHSALT